MNSADIGLLFDHLYWVRDRLLRAAAEPGVQMTDPSPPTIRDLRRTLVHELDVEWSWRVRLAGPDPALFSTAEGELEPADFPDVAAIADRWATDEAEMRAWLASLDESALNGPCHAERSGSHPLWFHLQHIYTHALQQFSDAAVLLTRAGHSPGEIDFLDFVETRLDRRVPGNSG
jgi:uncharacterized damage-inducible protein DinB